MTRKLTPSPLTAAAFSPYGDVLAVSGPPDKVINQGMCGRHHDLACLDFGSGRAGLSLFDGKARTFPYTLELVERHPEGSQAFVPMDGVPMLISVADDDNGTPINLKSFVSLPGQAINLHRNIWHGVLAPIGKPGRYIVIDRIGDGTNLEEYWFDDPWTVEAPKEE